MNKEGHIGLALLIISAILYGLNLTDVTSISTGFLVVIFSTLPDIDLRLRVSHRKYTHSLAAAVIFGVLMAIITKYG
ncbi:hypothetical protein DRN86_04215, partial [Candidatus Geothermarchaeota archaeon]